MTEEKEQKTTQETKEDIVEELSKVSRFQYFDWEKVKSFYYIGRLGSFTKAAQVLRLSQPSLSRQIAQLESHLGSPLFARRKKGVELTRKGEELLEIVATIFVDLTGFARYVRADNAKDKKERRKIRISSTHAINAYILSDLIFEYNQHRPDLAFELISDDHLIDIVLNDVDVAIRPYDPKARRVQQEPLFNLEKKLYASLNYLEKYGEPQTVEELKYHRLIAHAHAEEYPYADVSWILRLGMPGNTMHVPVFTSNSIECLIKAAENGIGIIANYKEMTIVRDSALKNILPSVSMPKIKCYFIYPDYFKQDQEILALKSYLSQKLHSKEN
jgi:DNA-binding transcriptional LysR family regulator